MWSPLTGRAGDPLLGEDGKVLVSGQDRRRSWCEVKPGPSPLFSRTRSRTEGKCPFALLPCQPPRVGPAAWASVLPTGRSASHSVSLLPRWPG